MAAPSPQAADVAAPSAAAAAAPGTGTTPQIGPGDAKGPGHGIEGTGPGISGEGAGAGDDYLDRVWHWVQRYEDNPNKGRKDPSYGTVWLSITVARDGTVVDVHVDQSSGVPYLDENAVQMVRNASPLPPVPASIPAAHVTFKMPTKYEPGFFGRLFQ
jgi:periplasmic protein TonB